MYLANELVYNLKKLLSQTLSCASEGKKRSRYREPVVTSEDTVKRLRCMQCRPLW